jgi:hypothetical protein
MESTNDSNVLEQIDAELWLLKGPLDVDMWKWCFENINQPYPKWKKEWIEILKERANSSEASLPKARYYYALWTLTRQIEYAREALNFFLKAAELHRKEPRYIMTWFFCYKISLKIATSLNVELKPTLEAIHGALIAEEDVNKKFATRILQILAEYAKGSSKVIAQNAEIKALFNEIAGEGEKIVESCRLAEEYSDEQMVLDYLVSLYKSIGKRELARGARLRQESSFERQAESSGSYMLKTTFLQSALNIYAELGMSDKIEDLKKRVHQASEEAIKKEFKTIEVGIEIPNEIIENLISSYIDLSPTEAIMKIISDENFVPKLDAVKKEVDDLRKKYPVASLFPVKVYDDGLPRRVVTTNAERTEYEVNKQFVLGVKIAMSFLSRVLETLKTNSLTKDTILEYLKGRKNIDPESLAFIDNALDLYFSKNYVGAVHILTCRMEPLLRNLLNSHGKTPTKFDAVEKGMDYLLLGSLISDVTPFIGEDMTKFLEVTLTQKGENIRNDVCHGFMKIESFTEQLANKLIFIILKLADV